MCFTYLNRMLTWSALYMVTCLYFSKCDILKGEQFTIQPGVWFPHHKSHVTLIYFFEILSTYVYIFFQLWLCKYLVISVTVIYILSFKWAVVEEILSCTFPWCWPCPRSVLSYSQGPTRILAKGSWHYHPRFC